MTNLPTDEVHESNGCLPLDVAVTQEKQLAIEFEKAIWGTAGSVAIER